MFIKDIKKGEYFKLPGRNVVYVRDDYNRSTKKYDAFRFDDINAFRSFKSDTVVEVDFIF